MAFPVPDVTPSAGQGLQTGFIYVNICSKIFVFSLKTDCKKKQNSTYKFRCVKLFTFAENLNDHEI